MFEKKLFSAKHDFKTGTLSKISFIFGAICLALFIFFKIISAIVTDGSEGIVYQLYELSISQTSDTLAAFGIILIAVGIIFYCRYVRGNPVLVAFEINATVFLLRAAATEPRGNDTTAVPPACFFELHQQGFFRRGLGDLAEILERRTAYPVARRFVCF